MSDLYSFPAQQTQVALRGSVAIINTGNKTVTSGTFAAYVATLQSFGGPPQITGSTALMTASGQSSFPIGTLAPGARQIITFYHQGSIDTRLKLPVGTSAAGQSVVGVVTCNLTRWPTSTARRRWLPSCQGTL